MDAQKCGVRSSSLSYFLLSSVFEMDTQKCDLQWVDSNGC